MKRNLFPALGLLLVQFSSLFSISFAQNISGEDFTDSSEFFKKAIQKPKSKRNNEAKIEAIIKKMT